MFASFFRSREWAVWAWPGAIIIILGTWYQVQVDVAINEWFGSFYGPSKAHEAVSGGVAPRKNEPCGRGASEKMTLPFTLHEPARGK